MAKEKPDTPAEKGSGTSMTKLIIVLVALQLVMFGGFGAFLHFSGALGGGVAHAESGAAETEKPAGDEAEEKAPAIYIGLEPAFVVNSADQSGASRFMQVTIQVMTRDPEIEQAVTTHMPVIRNSIVLLLSSQSVESVSGVEGKEKLRAKVLEGIRSILEERTGKPGVEEVYFTSFVIQ